MHLLNTLTLEALLFNPGLGLTGKMSEKRLSQSTSNTVGKMSKIQASIGSAFPWWCKLKEAKELKTHLFSAGQVR